MYNPASFNPVVFNPDHSRDHLSLSQLAIENLKEKFTLLEVKQDGSHVFKCYRRSFERLFPVLKAINLGKIMVQWDKPNDIITVKATEE